MTVYHKVGSRNGVFEEHCPCPCPSITLVGRSATAIAIMQIIHTATTGAVGGHGGRLYGCRCGRGGRGAWEEQR